MNKFMSNVDEALQISKKLTPKEGGRGIRDKLKPRDKNVRITSDLYEEMMGYIRKRHYNADFYDVCVEAWECLKKQKERRG
jgi:hypothetical protein